MTRVLQREGNPPPLGEAIQNHGRIFKSVHIPQLIDDEKYRRGALAKSWGIERPERAGAFARAIRET